MAWTTPTVRATGYLVTADDWNTDIVANLIYLKGGAGAIAIDDDIVLATGKELVADKIFAGPYRALHLGSVREVSIDWSSRFSDDALDDTYQLQQGRGNGGEIREGGTGQVSLKVDLDHGSGSYVWFALLDEDNGGLATPFNCSRNPYLRIEFSNIENSQYSQTFLGFRDIPGNSLPLASAENLAGIGWYGNVGPSGTWIAYNCDGGGTYEQTSLTTLTASVRHTVEVIIISGTEVDIFVDGTLEHTGNTYLPSGDVYFAVNFVGTGDPVANNGYLTVGKLLAQENLT